MLQCVVVIFSYSFGIKVCQVGLTLFANISAFKEYLPPRLFYLFLTLQEMTGEVWRESRAAQESNDRLHRLGGERLITGGGQVVGTCECDVEGGHGYSMGDGSAEGRRKVVAPRARCVEREGEYRVAIDRLRLGGAAECRKSRLVEGSDMPREHQGDTAIGITYKDIEGGTAIAVQDRQRLLPRSIGEDGAQG